MTNHESQPLVSVGMPVYNGEKHIRQALDSLLAQDFKDFELIISDDASTDDTAEICKRYLEKDNRIKYYRNELNLGLWGNFNKALALARGSYFMWASHDDIWEPSYISEVLKIMESDKSIALAFSDFDLIGENGEQIRVYPKIFKLSSLETMFKRLFQFIMFEESDGKANLMYGIMRLNTLKEIGGFIDTLAADDLFLFSMLFQGNFYITDELLFHKRLANRPMSLWDKISNWHKYFVGYRRIISSSRLPWPQKIALHLVTAFREVQFQMRFIKPIFQIKPILLRIVSLGLRNISPVFRKRQRFYRGKHKNISLG